MTDHICPCCGKPAGDLSVRLGVPDRFLGHPELADDDIWQATTLPSPFDDHRAYIRALLHIPLIGKHPDMLYCVWVEAAEADVLHAMDVWNDAAGYAKVSMHGYLANAIQPWGLLGAQVHIGVRDINELPHVEAARHRVLNRILTEPQPYETVVPSV